MNRRAAIYCRVSTAEQVEGTSLDTQGHQCRRFAAAHDWEVVGEYIDEGVSGAAKSRPELDRLLTAVRRGEVDVVVVAKLDRLGRLMRSLTTVLGEWDDLGVTLMSVSEAFDSSTPAGRLQRNILGSFAEMERDRIRERMLDGVEATVRAGHWPGGPAPFGWRLVRDAASRHTTVEIEPDESATIRRAFDLFVKERYSTHQVARMLNEEQRPPRGRPGSAQRRWTGHSFRNALSDSDHWSGTWTYRRRGPGRPNGISDPPVTIAIPPVLDELEVAQLRSRLRETTTPAPRRSDQPVHLLTGRITSPHGRPMYGVRESGRPTVYACADAPGMGSQNRCDCRRVNAELVESAVWGVLRDLLTEPKRLHAMVDDALRAADAAETISTGDARMLARRVRDLERTFGETVGQLLADGMDPTIMQHATATLRGRLDEARLKHSQALAWEAANIKVRDQRQRVWEAASRAVELLDASDPRQRRRLIDLLDVSVGIEGFEQCSMCFGKGRIPDPRALPITGRRRPDGVKRMKAPKCPTCHGHRCVPTISISGAIPAPSPTVEEKRVAFRVVAAS